MRSGSVFSDVSCCCAECVGVVECVSEPSVASVAEESSNFPCVVVVVDAKFLTFGFRRSTDRAGVPVDGSQFVVERLASFMTPVARVAAC